MKLRALTGLEKIELENENKELLAQAEGLRKILSDRLELDRVLIGELEVIKQQHGDARRTDITNVVINADDYYGASAFQSIYDYLSNAEDGDKYNYCMVGYNLENTLTENGHVARGVCTVDEEGKGALVGKNKNVKVDYLTSFMDGRILDVSSGFHPQGHEPIEFKTGARQMIPGFDIMVQEMKVGESRTCVIPPELAYGKAGHPAGIPGDTWLLFQIKVLSAK